MIRTASRVVLGGGLFGCYAALLLAERGHDVVLVEQCPTLLSRASYINQARLHSGLHYPRSLSTATEALQYLGQFRDRFPTAVHDFTQIYAVARYNSKTSGDVFAAFVHRLGAPAEEVDPERWFHSGTVSRAFQVEEPSFDATVLRELLTKELSSQPAIDIRCSTALTGGAVGGGSVTLNLSDGTTIETDGLVVAAYAGTNAVRESLGLAYLPITFELTEVILGTVTSSLEDFGFTVMDGPFWSLMPFGHSGQVSLTSVGLTPLRRSSDQPVFACQAKREDCTPLRLAECSTCPVRPPSAVMHQQQQMALFLKDASAFSPTSSLLTVKAVLTATQVDDARPTVIHKEPDHDVWTVFSGKVSTLFDLDEALS